MAYGESNVTYPMMSRDAKWSRLSHIRGVHGSGKPHGNPIPMGIPWVWE